MLLPLHLSAQPTPDFFATQEPHAANLLPFAVHQHQCVAHSKCHAVHLNRFAARIHASFLDADFCDACCTAANHAARQQLPIRAVHLLHAIHQLQHLAVHLLLHAADQQTTVPLMATALPPTVLTGSKADSGVVKLKRFPRTLPQNQKSGV